MGAAYPGYNIDSSDVIILLTFSFVVLVHHSYTSCVFKCFKKKINKQFTLFSGEISKLFWRHSSQSVSVWINP